jgi:hypothetical protein
MQMISAAALLVLTHVFQLSGRRRALTRAALAEACALEPSALRSALDELCRAALLDLPRLRLTLSGLALATAARAGSRRPKRRVERPQVVRYESPIALFAQRELPRAVA